MGRARGACDPRGMRVWVALWTVYIVWGSTYLAIRYVVETMPALLSAAAVLPRRPALRGVARCPARAVGAAGHAARSCSAARSSGSRCCSAATAWCRSARTRASRPGSRRSSIATVPLWVVLFRRATGERVGARRRCGSCSASRASRCCCSPATGPTGADRRDAHPRRRRVLLGERVVRVRAARLPADPIRATACADARRRRACASSGCSRARAGRSTSRLLDESVLAFAYLVLVGSLCAFTAYAWLLKHAPISQVATYAYVNPVVAIALGALFVDEEVTPLMGVAAVYPRVGGGDDQAGGAARRPPPPPSETTGAPRARPSPSLRGMDRAPHPTSPSSGRRRASRRTSRRTSAASSSASTPTPTRRPPTSAASSASATSRSAPARCGRRRRRRTTGSRWASCATPPTSARRSSAAGRVPSPRTTALVAAPAYRGDGARRDRAEQLTAARLHVPAADARTAPARSRRSRPRSPTSEA